ncbi:hypothetical protein [Synechococcus sp. BIOS-E4-1]|uniref:hypothetical protein n=1 Tax=Synechococcus sp. BIOS-E4-1 TaxID=1400864 RepID=UPI001645954D|nr:hypothetical protein [Synechococcus sp. BIOS-E4-1]
MGSVWFPKALAYQTNPFDRLVALYDRPPRKASDVVHVEPAAQEPVRELITVEDRHRRHVALLDRFAQEGRFRVSVKHAQAMAERLNHEGDTEPIRQQMEAAGFFSVPKRNQRVELDEPIPGAYCADSGWLLRPAPGLYAPLRDTGGNLLGWELRKDSYRGGRYQVLSTGEACPQLLPETGEQPINWCPPRAEAPASGWQTIVLVEGKGIKPWVTARFGIPVLGCGGSLSGFGAQAQLLAACELLAPGGRIVLFADAGWLVNPNVAMAMAKTVAVLVHAGHQPVVASARPWEPEGSGIGKKKKQVRQGPDLVFYAGSDPDELDPWSFSDCLVKAQPIEWWAHQVKTPEEVRERITKGLAFSAEADRQEDHIRRHGNANRRRRFNTRPELMESELDSVEFDPGEQLEGTVAAIERNKKAEAQRRRQWCLSHKPDLDKACAALEQFPVLPFDSDALTSDPTMLLACRKAWLSAFLLAEHLGHYEWLPGWVECAEDVLRIGQLNDEDEDQYREFQISEKERIAAEFPYEPLPQLVINTSGTGSGKTHTIAQPEASRSIWSTAGDSRTGGIVFVSSNYRCPPVEELKSWHQIPARHGGLESVQTPDGSVRLIRASEDTPPETLAEQANCSYAHRFAQVLSRGHELDGIQKWCNDECPFRPQRTEDGANVGGDGSCQWKHEMERVVEETCRPKSTRKDWVQRLTTSTQGLVGLSSYGAGHLQNSTVVIDESDQLPDAVWQTITITREDLCRIGDVTREWFWDPRDQELAHGLVCSLVRLLDPPVQKKGEAWRRDHGEDPNQCRSHPLVVKALEAIAAAYGTEDGGVQLPPRWLFAPDTKRPMVWALGAQTAEQQAKRINQVAMPLLPDLLRAVMPRLMGSDGHTLKVSKNTIDGKDQRVLELSRRRPEFRNAIRMAATTVILDATERPEDLLGMLRLPATGDDPRAVAQVIKQRPGPQSQNTGASGAEVLMSQVPCLGSMGRSRRTELTRKRNEFVDSWRERQLARGLAPEQIGVIDHKPFCRSDRSDEQPWLTVAARGGNYFSKARALLLVGMPISNLNSLAAENELRGGPGAGDSASRGFQTHLNHRVGIEFVQARGRLREGLREGESLELWMLGDADLSALCDQNKWTRPRPVRATEVMGGGVKTAEDQALESVLRTIVKLIQSSEALPSRQEELCKLAGVSYSAFRRAARKQGITIGELERLAERTVRRMTPNQSDLSVTDTPVNALVA